MITINKDFRVTENRHEYRIERFQGKGWTPVAFCTTAKSLAKVLREKMANRAAHLAREEAHFAFDDNCTQDLVSYLPSKRGASK